jgi:hypothetical protein
MLRIFAIFYILVSPAWPMPQELCKTTVAGLSTHELEVLRAHIQEDFLGFKIARFEPRDFTPALESAVRKLGADLIVIPSPGEFDHKLFKETDGYFYQPEKIVWRLPAKSLSEYLASLTSKDRTRFQNKLQRSEAVTYEMQEMTPDRFAEFFQIYKKEIIERERGRAAIDETWPNNHDLLNYRAMFFRDPGTKELLGGAILKLDKKEQMATIGYAAYTDAGRPLELARRTFAEALNFANKAGFRELSYGKDQNLYGHHLSVGLMEYKAGLGFSPKPSGNKQIIKILNPAKFHNEYSFFTIEGEKLAAKHFSLAPRSVQVPNETKLTQLSSQAIELPDNAIAPIRLLESHLSLEQIDKLAEVYQKVFYPTEPHAFSVLLNSDAAYDPLLKTVNLLMVLRKGNASMDYLLEYARREGFLKQPTQHQSIFSSNEIHQSQFRGKLATFLSQNRHPSLMEAMLREVSLNVFDSVQPLELASDANESLLVRSFLDSVHKQYGSEGLEKVVVKIENIFDLHELKQNWNMIAETKPFVPRGHFTVDDIQLNLYVDPTHIAEARALVRELSELFARSGVNFDLVLHRKTPIITDTIGGQWAATVQNFLDLDRETLQDVADGAGRYAFGQYGIGALLKQKLTRLATLIHPNTAPANATRQLFAEDIARYASNAAQLKIFMFEAGIDPSQFVFWKRRLTDVIEDLYDRGSRKDLTRFFAMVKQRYDNAKLEPTVDENIERVSRPSSLLHVNVDSNEVQQLVRGMSHLMVDAHREMQSFLRARLGLSEEVRVGLSPYEIASDIVLEYFERFRKVPSLDAGELKKIEEEFVQSKSTLGQAITWAVMNPDKPLSEEFINRTFRQIREHIQHSDWLPPNTLVFLFRMLGEPKWAAEAEALFRSLPHNTHFSFFIRPKSRKNEYLDDIDRNLALLQRNPEQVAKIKDLLKAMLQKIQPHAVNDADNDSNFEFAYVLLTRLNQPTDEIWKVMVEYARMHPEGGARLLTDIHETRDLIKGSMQGHEAVLYTVLENAPPSLTEWLERPVDTYSNYASTPWPQHGFSKNTQPVLRWFSEKVKRNLMDETQQVQIISQILLNESDINDENLEQIAENIFRVRNEDQRKIFLRDLKQRLTNNSFESFEIFRWMVSLLERVDPLAQQNLFRDIFANAEFVKKHPWEKYGFSPEVIERVNTFAAHKDFSSRHADLLVTLLLSHDNREFNKIWISQLITSTPEKAFHTMVQFLQYWQSLSQEARNIYLIDRVDELLADTRIKATKEAQGDSYAKVKSDVVAFEQSGKLVPEGLQKRLQKLEEMRKLLDGRMRANSDEAIKAANARINAAVLVDHPPKIRAEDEQKLLINTELKKLNDRLVFPRDIRDRVLTFITEKNFELLRSTGVLDRFAQFSGFANAKGKEMLIKLLDRYSDPKNARVVEIERPDLGGLKTKNFDYFGKFEKLRAQLLEAGISQQEADRFLPLWRNLWYFDKVGSSDDYVTVTHDLERWTKHGEEPVKSCQRLSSSAADLASENWNHQFGPSPNKDGRPLARILLGQLKLAEYRREGKVLARSVVEVTVDPVTRKLALLGERIYRSFGTSDADEFERGIYRYAASLGIEKNEVFLADQIQNLGQVVSRPNPLPEEFRIYRDTIRPH